MAKTFTDINGMIVTIEPRQTRYYTDEDIVSGEVSRYIIEVSEIPYEVDKITYTKVKEFVENY